MRVNTLILILSFSLTLLMGFFVYKLNSNLVSLDLLFLDIETSLGKVVLFSVLIGFFILYSTIFLAIILPSFSSPNVLIKCDKFLLSIVFTTSCAEKLFKPICIFKEPSDMNEKPL